MRNLWLGTWCKGVKIRKVWWWIKLMKADSTRYAEQINLLRLITTRTSNVVVATQAQMVGHLDSITYWYPWIVNSTMFQMPSADRHHSTSLFLCRADILTCCWKRERVGKKTKIKIKKKKINKFMYFHCQINM